MLDDRFGDVGDVSLDGLMEDAGAGRITRSQLIAGAAALGVSASTMGALLASAGPAMAAGSAPKRGGTLRVAGGGNGQNDTLDTAKMVDPLDGMRIRSLYDQLFFSDHEYKPQPWLASEVESTKDAKIWTLRLVQGATFHNGAPVTAEDVQFTIKRTLDPATKAFGADVLAFMKGAQFTIMDPRTLRIKLATPYADLPSVFADPGTNILPKTFDQATANTAPIGSGPFKFESFTPGRESTFVRNENYWKSGYPFADKLVITDIADASARNNALLGGQVDLIVNISYSAAQPLKARGAQIINIPGTTTLPICCVMDMKPFNNAKLREAFALSIDRAKAVAIVFRGFGRVGNDQPISDAYPYHPVGLKTRKRDIPRAKQLLKEAGYPNGIDVTLITGDASPGMLDMATVIAGQVKDSGFRVKLRKWPADSFWNDVWLKKNFYTSAWTQKSTPELYLARTAYSKGQWNEAHIKDPQIDRLLTKARSITDPKARTKLYTQAMGRVQNTSSWINVGYGNLLHASSKNFKWEQAPPPLSAPHLFNANIS